ncbi:predicted protein [Nematostella vectensis]|uniref:Creatine kinase n=2 Tax=Nematostella vectensis TaxID=45351 RepID=A7S6L6_NEMVE|nr:predicted protein [Nematostella vectensis]|eukprot:XP_001632702.1 predicted protein [Nematostella vectensis]
MALREEALANFPALWNHNNIMARHLTPEMYVHLCDRKTSNGFTLDQAIQPGVDNPTHPNISPCGIVAGDEESFRVFAELFDLVIEERHNGYKQNATHVSDTNPTKVKHGKFDENFVLSCRVRACRSIKGFRLSPINSRKEKRGIEQIAKNALGTMQGEFEGRYYALSSMTPQDYHHLSLEHVLSDATKHPLIVSSGMSRDWPDGRGVWHTKDKSFLIWVNEEDHLRVISMETGGDLERTYERFYRGLKELESRIQKFGHEFMRNRHLGYINTCPSNLGTGLRASVHVKLPCLGKDPRFDAILCSLRLQKRGTDGDNTPIREDIYDISNADRLGYTEVQLVQKVIDGVNLLIKMEKRLERNQSINEFVPFKL